MMMQDDMPEITPQDLRESRPEAGENRENRLKRMTMRSWRRGTKEMDMILGPFADTQLAELSPQDLDLYDDMLTENDQDLYKWVTGAAPAPGEYLALLTTISAHAQSK